MTGKDAKALLLVTALLHATALLVCAQVGFPESCEWDLNVRREVECDGDELAVIPGAVSPARRRDATVIQHVQLEGQSSLREVGRASFARLFPLLASVSLANTGLRDIRPYAFDGLTHLRQVKVTSSAELHSLDWLSFASSSLSGSYHLDVADLVPSCSCSLHWVASAERLRDKPPQHHVALPGIPVAQRDRKAFEKTHWRLYGLPDTLDLPRRCLDGEAERDIGDHLQEACAEEAKAAAGLSLGVSLSQGRESVQVFSANATERRVTCRLSHEGVYLTSPVDLEVRVWEKVWQKRAVKGQRSYFRLRRAVRSEVVERTADSLTVALTGDDAPQGYAHCRLATPHPQVLEPIAAIVPVATRTKPRIAALWPVFQLDAGPHFCHYVLKAYPPPKISWLNTSDGREIKYRELKFDLKDYVGGYKTNLPYDFYLFSGDLLVHVYRTTRGNYTFRACNSEGCSEAECNLSWPGFDWPLAPVSTANPAKAGLSPAALVLFVLIGVSAVTAASYFGYHCSRKADAAKRSGYQVRGVDGLISRSSGSFSRGQEMRSLAQPQPLLPHSESVEEGNSLYNVHSLDFLRFLQLPAYLFHPAERLKLAEDIGEGCFSNVYLATLSRCSEEEDVLGLFPDDSAAVTVAVKCPKCNTAQMREGLRHEIRCLSLLQHRNVVRFLGLSLQPKDGVWLLFEYLPRGSLRDLLIASVGETSHEEGRLTEASSLGRDQLLDICAQVGLGLEFLARHHVVHRDLATRNCLVGEGAEGRLTVKLSDFGMSRDIYYAEYYKVTGQKCMPIRWMCPEALIRGIFSHAGDVWSLGVVLWEVFTLGRQPWFGFSNVEVIAKVSNGEVLDVPPEAPAEVATLMVACWAYDPEQRPKAHQAYASLAALLPEALRVEAAEDSPLLKDADDSIDVL